MGVVGSGVRENIIVSYVSRPKSQKTQSLVDYKSISKKARGRTVSPELGRLRNLGCAWHGGAGYFWRKPRPVAASHPERCPTVISGIELVALAIDEAMVSSVKCRSQEESSVILRAMRHKPSRTTLPLPGAKLKPIRKTPWNIFPSSLGASLGTN